MWFPLFLFACSDPPADLPEPTPPERQEAVEDDGPTLAVYLVVDQLPMELFRRMQPHFTGGFARLTGDEAWVGKGVYTHAVTFTCPGHATLATGASPLVHGIIGNNWVVDGKGQYCANLENLLADTLADRVQASGGKVAAISVKDRAAIMMGGRTPDASIWYEKKKGTWNEAAPKWATQQVIDDVLNSTWTPLQPKLYIQHFPDAQAHEEQHTPMGGDTYPHGPPGTDNPSYFRMMPASGGVLTDLGLTAVDQLALGADGSPDLLAISYSQTDYIGHAFTPQSWEAMDALLHLDADLARLFEGLDAKVGADNYTVVLTSDHGAANAQATRVWGEDLEARANKALNDLSIPAEAKFMVPFLFIHGDDVTPEQRTAGASAIAKSVADLEGVKASMAWRAEGVPDDLKTAAEVRQSLHPERGGDVYVLVAEDTVIGYNRPPQGTGHGGPWYHDTQVPILMHGPGIPAAADRQADMRQVAPTVATLMGVDAPQQAELPPISL